jgi:hypothetical protein
VFFQIRMNEDIPRKRRVHRHCCRNLGPPEALPYTPLLTRPGAFRAFEPENTGCPTPPAFHRSIGAFLIVNYNRRRDANIARISGNVCIITDDEFPPVRAHALGHGGTGGALPLPLRLQREMLPASKQHVLPQAAKFVLGAAAAVPHLSRRQVQLPSNLMYRSLFDRAHPQNLEIDCGHFFT